VVRVRVMSSRARVCVKKIRGCGCLWLNSNSGIILFMITAVVVEERVLYVCSLVEVGRAGS